MNKQDLLDLNDEIEEAKDEVNRLEGRKEHLVQELEDDWGCSSLKEASKKLSELKGEIKELEKKIEEGTKELQEKYEV